MLMSQEAVLGIRFYRSFKVLPGLRVNLSKSGLSGSIGRAGLNVNLSKRGKRFTFGLPGSGASYVTQSKWDKTAPTGNGVAPSGMGLPIAAAVAGAIVFLIALIAVAL